MTRVIVCSTLFALALAAPSLGAPTTLSVDTNAQRNPAVPTAGCTLGDALVAANLDAPVGGCAAPNLGSGGPFTIVLPAGSGPYVLSGADSPGTGGDNGLPIVDAVVTVLGNGNAIERDAALACPAGAGSDFRLLEVAETGDLALDDLTVRGGCAPSGGGIRNEGVLSLLRTRVVSNRATAGNGGGVENQGGTLLLDESEVSGNTASGLGGGLYNGLGDVLLNRSTVAENDADSGGGLENLIGDAVVMNSTVSGNRAVNGAGVENSGGGSLELTSSTVAGNRATSTGHGLLNRNGTMRFASSVLHDRCTFQRSPGNADRGGNLERANTCGLQAASSFANTDALIGPLAANGGPTRTHALLTGSPAIDQGDDALCAGPDVAGLDQRGVERPDGDSAGAGRCDVGAVEFFDCDGNGVDDGSEIGANPALDHDGNGVLDACEDSPPVADAGPDQTLECTSPNGADVTLDGSASHDPDGGPLAFTWLGAFGATAGMTPVVALPLGSEVVDLSVEDVAGNQASDSVQVDVLDQTPPSVEASLDPLRGRGSWQRLRVEFSCMDLCSAETAVTAEVDGLPVQSGDVVAVRGWGNASTPMLNVQCEDASGNVTEASAEAARPPAKSKVHYRWHRVKHHGHHGHHRHHHHAKHHRRHERKHHHR